MSNTVVIRRGVPIIALLGAILVVLKVIGLSSLSWLWTLAPFWIGPLLALGIPIVTIGVAVCLAAFVGMGAWVFDLWDNHNKRRKLRKNS